MFIRYTAATCLAALFLASCESTSGPGDPVPAQVDAISGNDQEGTAGAELAQPLVVRVLDEDGEPVPGQTVHFRVVSGGGSLAAGSARTDAQGEARERWILGTSTADSQRVEAAVADPSAARPLLTATFRATAAAGPAARVVLTPDTLRFNALGQTSALEVRAYDAFGNALGGQPVTLIAQNSAVAALDGTVARAVGNGSTLIVASVPGSAVADTTPVVVSQVAATLTVAPAPESLAVGDTTRLRATAFDARGNPIPNAAFAFSTASTAVTLSAAGRVTAVSPGTATVRVHADSASADASFMVQRALGAAQLSAGSNLACAIRPDGRAACWGSNGNGETGIGTLGPDSCGAGTHTRSCTKRATPVAGERAFARISAGSLHACALTPDGAAYCWGLGSSGALGTGDTFSRRAPAAVAGGHTFASIAAGAAHTCALTGAGAAYCWGSNDAGRLGTGAQASTSTPVPISGGQTFSSITGGGGHTCALAASGTAYCWGDNRYGQLGRGDTVPSTVPVAVSGGLAFVAISAGASHTCGLTAQGQAYCWGRNLDGELGIGSAAGFADMPAAVAGAHRFRMVGAGVFHTCAVDDASRAYCWGEVAPGYTPGGRVTSPVPQAVPGGDSMATADAGGGFACGIGTDGRARCWGGNYSGYLGNGTITDSRSPVLVEPS
jgi:alpha-tubulin suppressor-like RCC1 family protein